MDDYTPQLTKQEGFKLNRNQLKYLLIIAMLSDHLAWRYVPTVSVLGQIMHFIGRLTGPGMAVLLAEGYQYTRSKKKYAIRLLIFALLSWAPCSLFNYNRFPYIGMDMFGVIWTLFLAFVTVWMWDSIKGKKPLKIFLVVIFCILSLFGDWCIFAVLWALFCYIYRDNEKKKWISFAIVAVIEVVLACLMSGLSQLFQLGVVLVPIVFIYFYNREPGSKKPFHKWFFYVFYPLHILILYFMRCLGC